PTAVHAPPLPGMMVAGVGSMSIDELRYAMERVPDALRDVWSTRAGWVLIGVVAQLVTAAGGAWFAWSRGVTFLSFAVVLVACAAGQSVAVVAVLRPGSSARSAMLVDRHQGLTIAGMVVTGILGVCIAVPVLDHVLAEPGNPEMALFFSWLALMLTSLAGLFGIQASSIRRQ
ncbi:MAG: hypothetical protein QOH03_5390, partial [Kribbellaceae bacterium]|nr:hypothetical protein [Kribbellaceae bacterium]